MHFVSSDGWSGWMRHTLAFSPSSSGLTCLYWEVLAPALWCWWRQFHSPLAPLVWDRSSLQVEELLSAPSLPPRDHNPWQEGAGEKELPKAWADAELLIFPFLLLF